MRDLGLYDILKNKTQQSVSKFNIKQSRLIIPNLRCQFDFERKKMIFLIDSFFSRYLKNYKCYIYDITIKILF